MTMEQLEKAVEIGNKITKGKLNIEKIDKSKKMVIAVVVEEYDGLQYVDRNKELEISQDGELAKIIRSYIENQVAELEKQLEEL